MTAARNFSAARGVAVLAIPLVAISALMFAAQCNAAAKSSSDGCVGAYGWPVAPFDEPHPVRANFGDPRTTFDEVGSRETLLAGDGTFSFHQGVDISAPDGSPVYAVASGSVTFARGGRVTVRCRNGRSFQYWHIEPAVRAGQRAVAGETVLGFIQPKREHVHLTHLERKGPVNPLARAHLTPYADHTTPQVLGITIKPRANGLQFVAEAVDAPALGVPGRWHGFPVTPALVSWRIERGGRVVVPTRVARDVRRVVPKNDRFWETYARGTHQNWPVFAGRKLRFQAGTYLFRLSQRDLDSSRFADGMYEFVVFAGDTAGNRDIQRFQFAFDSRDGFKYSRRLSGS